MDTCQQNEKDISKVFTFVRAQLQAKEKELLELQRSDPGLLAPGSEQIDVLLDAIACLQLSIPDDDDSFIFASTSDYNDSSCDDFNSIKTLPSAVWLRQSTPVKQQYEEQPSICNHLLSLPGDAYLASSWPSSFETTTTTQNESVRRNSMCSHLLSMPINSFKSSSNTSKAIEINHNKNFNWTQQQQDEERPSMFNHLLSLPSDTYLASPLSSSCESTGTTQNGSVRRNSMLAYIEINNNKNSNLTQQQERQPSIFNHLLSLPSDAYLASPLPSSYEATTKTQNESVPRNSMCSHLLSMPINSFKSSSNTGTSIEIKNNKTSNLAQRQYERRPSICDHLLSLPSDAYLASSLSSSCETTTTTQNESFHRNSMFSHLLCMPINSFKPSSNTSTSIGINNNKTSQNNVLPTTTTTKATTKSLLNTGMEFSREFWLRNSQNAAYN